MFSAKNPIFQTLLLLILAVPVVATTSLILGVTEGATRGFMANEMAPVLAQLNSSSTYEFSLKVFSTHDDLYSALRSGAVDLAFLGAMKYVEAHSEIGAIPIVAEGPAVRSMFVVAPGSPFKSVADLKGKRIAFGYADSTTTYLIPSLILSKYGIHKDDMKSTFVGHHPQELVDQMLAGKFDACPVSDYIYEKNKEKVRVLETSDDYAGPPIVVKKDFDPKAIDGIRALFLAYRPTAANESKHFGHGAIAVTDNDYNRIRFLCKVLFNKMYK